MGQRGQAQDRGGCHRIGEDGHGQRGLSQGRGDGHWNRRFAMEQTGL